MGEYPSMHREGCLRLNKEWNRQRRIPNTFEIQLQGGHFSHERVNILLLTGGDQSRGYPTPLLKNQFRLLLQNIKPKNSIDLTEAGVTTLDLNPIEHARFHLKIVTKTDGVQGPLTSSPSPDFNPTEHPLRRDSRMESLKKHLSTETLSSY